MRRLDGTADLASGTQTALRFQLLRGGRPARLEPHLGAYAHLSHFEVRTQGLKHLRPLPATLPANANATATADAPAGGVLDFHAAFAERGDKRMVLQFRAGGAVHQVAFTVFTTGPRPENP